MHLIPGVLGIRVIRYRRGGDFGADAVTGQERDLVRVLGRHRHGWGHAGPRAGAEAGPQSSTLEGRRQERQGSRDHEVTRSHIHPDRHDTSARSEVQTEKVIERRSRSWKASFTHVHA